MGLSIILQIKHNWLVVRSANGDAMILLVESFYKVDNSLDAVSGSRWFTTLDLKSAYSQITKFPEDQHNTAFSTPFGLYNFKRMPFGIANAPASFQRIMANLFRKELMQRVICYLDDILIHSNTID